MSFPLDEFLTDHAHLTRRFFLSLGATGSAALATMPLAAEGSPRDPTLQAAIDKLETWLTLPEKFRDVSRGKPVPHSLSEETRQQVGMTRESWQLEVLADPEHPVRLHKSLRILRT